MKTMISLMAAALGTAGAAFAAGTSRSWSTRKRRGRGPRPPKDAAFISNVLADDWKGQDTGGVMQGKSIWSAMFTSARSPHGHTNHDVHARVFGKFAVVQGNLDDETVELQGQGHQRHL